MCGICAVRLGVEHEETRMAAMLVHEGIFALQYRGQESAGIGAIDGDGRFWVEKGLGLVDEVFNSQTKFGILTGRMAIGQNRYATTGSARWENAQPHGYTIGLAHNGNLTNTEALKQKHGLGEIESDTEVISELLHRFMSQGEWSQERLEHVLKYVLLPELAGAFSLVVMSSDCMIGVKDPHGFHPLCLGQREDGWVFASETSALEAVGATFVRELKNGEGVVIDEGLPRSFSLFPAKRQQRCVMEPVYFAGQSSLLDGREIHAMRLRAGEALALVDPVKADLVGSVPKSAIPAAIGYAKASGIPYGEVLDINPYAGRSFIAGAGDRAQKVMRKFKPLHETVAGKIIVLVDDSLVRGTTTRIIVRMLKEAGACEVHVRIASDKWKFPCFYGIDQPGDEELPGASMSVSEICADIGADSLAYLPVGALLESTELSVDEFCTACMTGDYPVTPPVPVSIGSSRSTV